MAEYVVVQDGEPFFSMWMRIIFQMLLIPNGGPLAKERSQQMIRAVQELYSEDSGKCPAGKDEKQLEANLRVEREVIQELSRIAGSPAP
jgi:hypothetical protein